MDPVVIERESLYEQIWTEPLVRVAARYGIPGPSLRKICVLLCVPRPSSGYWTQLAHGTALERPALPSARPGDPVEHAVVPVPPSARAAAIDAERGAARIVVPEKVAALHPLLRARPDRVRGKKPVPAGQLSGLDAIHVSPELHDRAVRVMHTVLTEFDARALRYEPTTSPEGRQRRGRIVVTVDGEPLRFSIFEWIRYVPVNAVPGKKSSEYDWLEPRAYRGDGRLRIRIDDGPYSPRTWRDEEGRPIELRLNTFMRGLHTAAAAERERRRTREENARRYQEEERLRQVAAERQRRHDGLLADARSRIADLHFARSLRSLAVEVEERTGGECRSAAERAWLDWARGVADRVEDSVLSTVGAAWASASS